MLQEYETELHKAAKDLLVIHRKVALPAVEIKFDQRQPIQLRPAATYELESVELEKKFGSFIPDVVCKVGGKTVLIEIRVTHAIDEEKLSKIRTEKVSVVEVDLSDVVREAPLDELTRHLIDPSPRKAWIHNAFAQARHDELVAASPLRHPVVRGYAIHIDNCPLRAAFSPDCRALIDKLDGQNTETRDTIRQASPAPR